MPHEINILVGSSEVTKRGIEGAHRTPFNAPGQREDLASGPVVAMPELESEQIVSVLGQITEQVELLIKMPSGR